MTNATNTLAIVFACTLLLALVASWEGGTTSSAAFQEKLLDVDTSAVQAVRIERSDASSVRLDRSNGTWSVGPADSAATYPANSQAVQRLFDTLPAADVNAVTTRQAEKHPQYGVDSTGTTVTMLGRNDESLGQVILGRTRIRRSQSRGRGQNPMQRMRRRQRGTPVTYVRSPDRPDVYAVEQSLRSIATRRVDDWRDKEIWAVDRSQIRRVDFTFPADSSFTMQRAAPGDTASSAARDTWISAGDTLSSTEVSSILRTLSSPQADGFADAHSPDSFGEARYEIRLQLADGTTRTLRLRPASSGDDFVAVADGFPYVVRLRKQRWTNSVLQGRSVLLENE